jgi:two-component sensor histidine kinase
MVKNLYIKLQGLNSPFIGKTDFSVEIKAPEFSEVLEKLPDLSEVLEKAVYKLEGEVDENGILKCNYLFQNEAFPQLKREIKNLVTDARDPKKFQGKRKPECGPFKVKFYVWDLDPASLGETIERPYYMNYVKPHTGIRIYRDYFRVWPYGEEDDDSFGLDLRRVNNPPVRLSRNQVIGIIEITSSENPELRDKTDREGLILNDDYEDFRNLVLMCLATIEAARREDKDKVDALREKKKPEDDVTLAIGSMKDKMKRKGHIDTYKEDVKKIETTYQRRVKEILEPLYVSAGLGIAYALPVHEILRNMGDMEKTLGTLVDDLKMRKASEESIAKLEKINQFAELIDDLVRGAGKLTRRGKPELIGLDSVVRDAHDIMNLRLKKDKIDVRIETKEKINVNMLRNLITTALLNILDNCSYWLMGNKDSDRKIIIITDHDKEGRPRIIVSDNGPGIKDDPALIIEPFFTRKPDGSGLGLYIVDRIMKAQEGEVQFLKKSDEKGLLDGANVALVFEKKKEKKQA